MIAYTRILNSNNNTHHLSHSIDITGTDDKLSQPLLILFINNKIHTRIYNVIYTHAY